MTSDNNISEIKDLIAKINGAWLAGRPAEMAAYFHDQIVIAQPGFAAHAHGKDVCIASYEKFVAAVTIANYHEHDHVVNVWGDTAVASYAFDISYEIETDPYRDTGRDVLVFAKVNGQWKVVWRTLIPQVAAK